MSLITRCPSCGTLFKVVPDQLKISDGWVRCGHCSDVFDAYAQLQSAESVGILEKPPVTAFGLPADEPFPARDEPTRMVPLPAGEAPRAPAAPASPPSVPDPDPPRRSRAVDPVTGARDFGAEDSSQTSVPASVGSDTDGLAPVSPDPAASADDGHIDRLLLAAAHDGQDPLDEHLQDLLQTGEPTRLPPNDAVDDPDESRPPEAARSGGASSSRGRRRRDSRGDARAERAGPESEVGFVRKARRASTWRRPMVRAVLGALALVLTLGLLAQVAVQERDFLAAAEPRLKPVLEALCEPVGCRVGPLRRVDAVVVEAAAFSKLLPDVFQLALTLRNGAALGVATPALEITLTDRQEQVVVRRVLSPADLRAPVLLAPAGEWSGSVRMAIEPGAGGARVTGYRVVAFYP